MIIQIISLPEDTTVFTNIVVYFRFENLKKWQLCEAIKTDNMVEPKNLAGMGGSFFCFQMLEGCCQELIILTVRYSA